MINPISKYLEYAQLAQASYAWFFSKGSIKDELTEANRGNFADKQAETFLSHYTLLSHQYNTLSGFSASVFKSASGEYTLAIRGTEVDLVGLVTDWGITDIADIGFNGIAVKQAIDLMNYYQQLTAVAGQPLVQYQYVDGPVLPGLPGYSITAGSITYTTSTATETGVLAGQHFTVTGHSLGGHLALIMGRLVPDMVDAVYTYNAPGFDTGLVGGSDHSEWFFDTLAEQQAEATGQPSTIGSSFDATKINNLVVEADWISEIGNVQDEQLAQFHESSGIASAHSIVGMTDSLALQSLFARIDPSLTLDKLNVLLKSASADPAKSLEVTLDALRTLFQQNYVYGNTHYTAVPTPDGAVVAARDVYYTNLYSLQEAIDNLPFTAFSIESLSGKSASQLISLAESDLAWRYALVKLNPFVVNGEAAFYDAINGQHELDLYDPVTGQGELSAQYLKDRAAFLANLIVVNTADQTESGSPWLISNAAQYFEDNSGYIQTRLYLGADESITTQPVGDIAQIKFGGWLDDTVVGGGKADRLYGGAGDDILTGNGGSDYLEGGKGEDTYVINPGDGHDTILDTDGLGVIMFGDIAAQGSANVADGKNWIQIGNTWEDKQNGLAYRLIDQADGSQDLYIYSTNGSVTVKGWSAGELGIELGANTPVPLAVTDFTIVGDLQPVDFNPAEAGVQTQTDGFGNIIVSAQAAPGREDVLYGSGGNDLIQSLDGNDFVDGRGGDDRIEGGTGQDLLQGGAGNDTVIGGTENDVVAGAEGNDQLYAETEYTLDEAFILGETQAASGQRGDLLDGGTGDDILIGETGNDILLGGMGKDVLMGLGGDDTIEGDGNFVSVDRNWGVTRTVTQEGDTTEYTRNYSFAIDATEDGDDDVIYGGAGNDWILAQGGNDFVDGGADDDVIFGGAGNDIILGQAGHDVLIGDNLHPNLDASLHGDDYLSGGEGNDELWGAGGSDHLEGGAGNDRLWGDGENVPAGYEGNDVLDGGAGDDQLVGGGGNDTLIGGDGADILFAGDGNDTLDGGLGNDYLDGGVGADIMAGGAGDDTYIVEDLDDVVVETEDAGNDAVLSSVSVALPDNVERLTLTGSVAIDATGNAADNTLFGNTEANRLSGGGGFDYLSGGGGDDTYVFNVGDGALSAEGYTESIRDNDGVNTLEFGADISVDDIQLTAFSDKLKLRYSAGDSLLVMDGLSSGVRWVGFDDGSIFGLDALYARNSQDAADQTTSEAGAKLVGSAINNLLSASGGGSIFRGGRGDDTLVGAGGGNLYIYERGDGVDHIYDMGGQTMPDGTPAPNRVQFGAGISLQDVRLAPGAEGTLEVLVAGDPSGKLILHSFDANDAANSSAIDFFDFADGTSISYADLLGSGFHVEGGTGDDTLRGANLPDVLLGNAGNDILYGYGGDDTLAGGEGNDLLIGGEGADLYAYASGQGSDTIVETDDGSINTLRLEAGLTPGDIELSADANQNLLLNITSTGDTLVLSNWLASGAALVQRIEFADGTVWTPEWIRQNLKVQSGTAGNDVLTALPGQATSLYGLAGNDTLNGGSGDDQLIGGSGNDGLGGGLGNDSYLFELGDGQDNLVETGGQDAVIYGAGIAAEDVLVSRVGSDLLLTHVNGTDQITIKGWFSYADHSTWVEGFHFADGTVWTADMLTSQTLTQVGTDGNDYLQGVNHFGDILRGGAGNDTLYGYSGDDILEGGTGYDYLYGSDGNDVLAVGPDGGYAAGGAGDDLYLYDAGDGNLNVSEGGGNDTLRFGTGIHVKDAQFQNQYGNLQITLSDGSQIVINSWFNSSDYSQVIERFEFADGTVLMASELNQVLLVQEGTAGSDTLNGTALDDTLIGAAGNDTLRGEYGNDLLRGDQGQDLLYGGYGDDQLYGGEGNDVLYGQAGNDHLDGGAGNDYLVGGAGNDDYRELGLGQDRILDSAGVDNLYFASDVLPEHLIISRVNADLRIGFAGREDSVTLQEWFRQPRNSIEAFFFSDGSQLSAADISSSFSLVSGNGSITGSAGDDLLYGGAGQDTLQGGAGNDLLDGGAGADSLVGGTGDDTYITDGNDTIVELPGEGIDTLVWASGAAVVLQAELENLVLAESAGYGATGNAENNHIIGNSQGNSLDGGAGADVLEGGLGSDTYYVDNPGDLVVERANEGDSDRVLASISYALPEHVEGLTLTGSAAINGFGNELDNSLTGNDAANVLMAGAGNDYLTGRLGIDTLVGGGGDDYYYLDGYDDILIEQVDEGYDRILINQVSEQKGNTQYVGTFTMADNIESLRMTGWVTHATLFGNAQDNEIDARGARVFDSQNGNVTWYYLAKVDIYAGDGNDTLYASEGGGILNGEFGNDVMYGGSGNDTYYVDSEFDQVIESSSSSTDSVHSTVSYALGTNLENLHLLGSADIDGTGNDKNNNLYGNSGNNVLVGGAGNDRLDGAGGNDTLIGGSGDDIYVVNSASLIAEQANDGIDRVEASISFSLGAHLEHLTLTGSAAIDGTGNELDNLIKGNSANNRLIGGDGNDTLDGMAGNDIMLGGAGDDSYYVNTSKDVVTEYANEGIDTVYSSITYTIGSDLENLTLTGSSAIRGTGNALDNMLIGNAASNTLSGGAGNDWIDGKEGADKMVGGLGDDTYVVDVSTDGITERSKEGTDHVLSSVTYTLSRNVENLALTGGATIDGSGNALDNVLTGNSADNNLDGGAGNDTLNGMGGADLLMGGKGDDTYIMGRGHGADTVVENDATAGNTDIAQFLSGIAADQIWFSKAANDLEVSVIGTADTLVIKDWYLGTAYHVEQFKTADGMTLLDSQVDNLVNAMASFAPPATGQTTLPSTYQPSLDPVIAANWQ